MVAIGLLLRAVEDRAGWQHFQQRHGEARQQNEQQRDSEPVRRHTSHRTIPMPRANLLIRRDARIRARLQGDRVEALRHLLIRATLTGKAARGRSPRSLRVLHHFSRGLERSGADIEGPLNGRPIQSDYWSLWSEGARG